MKSSFYWIGLFLADYTLFILPTALFTILVASLQLAAFSDSLTEFVFTMLTFGISIISLTYLISSFFNDQDTAIRWNIALQLFIGNLAPLSIMLIFAGLTSSSPFVTFVVTTFFLLNPMFTFYLANYQIVVNYVNSL